MDKRVLWGGAAAVGVGVVLLLRSNQSGDDAAAEGDDEWNRTAAAERQEGRLQAEEEEAAANPRQPVSCRQPWPWKGRSPRTRLQRRAGTQRCGGRATNKRNSRGISRVHINVLP